TPLIRFCDVVPRRGFGTIGMEPLFDLSFDVVPGPAATLQCRRDEYGGVIDAQAWRCRRGHAGKRPLCPAVTEETDGDLILLQVEQLLCAEPRRELTREAARVIGAALERNSRPSVGGQGFSRRVV